MLMKTDAKVLKDLAIPDLSKPTLPGLAYLLRRPDLWPKGFSWDYGNCNRCAMGLVTRMWRRPRRRACTDCMCQIFKIDEPTVYGFFLAFHGESLPQPEHIANRIERYLKSHAL